MTMNKTGQPAKATVVDPNSKPKAKPGPKPKKAEGQPETPPAESGATSAESAPSNGASAPTVPEETAGEVIAMEPYDAALAQLAQERIVNAQLHLNNRQKEFEGLLNQIRVKYEVGGFAMRAIDIPKGTVTRIKIA